MPRRSTREEILAAAARRFASAGYDCTSLMSLLGRSAWWLPRGLDRAVPNLDVEGQRLRERLGAETARERVRV
jgi:hypothetical protein